MANIHEGKLSAQPYSFAIVVSRFNEFITKRLLESALDCLRRHGAAENAIDVFYCPGAFEIPQLAQQVARSDVFYCPGTIENVDRILGGSVPAQTIERSEERRVGKECRSRWSPYH